MAYCYRIEHIKFSDCTNVSPPNLTVIVGPNCSGKSRALRDIVGLTCLSKAQWKPVVALEVVTTYPYDARALRDAYGFEGLMQTQPSLRFDFLKPDLEGGDHPDFGPRDIESVVRDQNLFPYLFGPQLTAFLKAETRLTMVAEDRSADSDHSAENLLQMLYNAGSTCALEIRELVKSAFPEIEIALDFSSPTRLQFRVSTDFSRLAPDPRDARAFLVKCERLDDHGDGLRSFVGIVTALKCLRRAVFLIDEPEAFLHPPQAFKIGQFIADQVSTKKQIIIATHSADVLRGIVFNSSEAQVIRINRVGTANKVRVLEQTELRNVILDPLLSAAGVLDGLFYEGVIVTEADADSRFYQSVSNKLRSDMDLHFVNADNKKPVPKVLAPYKRLGVGCAGIVDIDVLNSTEEFRRQLDAAGIKGREMDTAIEIQRRVDAEVRATPIAERLRVFLEKLAALNTLGQKAAEVTEPGEQEKEIVQILRELEKLKAEASPWQQVKRIGANGLLATHQDFQKLYALCSSCGLFINPCGELEASLVSYGVPWQSDKRIWIAQALQLVPKLQPEASKQPWKLIEDVHNYLHRHVS